MLMRLIFQNDYNFKMKTQKSYRYRTTIAVKNNQVNLLFLAHFFIY